jgi:transcriptional antiterminator NusG
VPRKKKAAVAEEETTKEAAASETQAPEEDIAAPVEGRAWYVIHTYSGYENKVKANLEHRIESMDARELVFQVIVPTEEEIEIRDGQRRTVEKKVFPGYVLVQMIELRDDDPESSRAWFVVRNTPGVTGFVGSGVKPTPLDVSEVRKILRQMRAEEPRVKVGFTIGQSVRVIDGPFMDFVGQVDEINLEKGRVRVLVSFFGRETPVELDFLQVERL